MRTIKFRGKCVADSKHAGKWVCGGYSEPPEDSKRNEGLITVYLGGSSTCKYHVIPNTVGQFTGMHDSIGREIYEGDIVYSEFEDGSNGSSLVGWNEKQSCFGVMDEYAYRSKLEGFEYPEFQNHVMLAFMRDAKLFKVIGNIHDNPELLKTTNY